MQCLRFGDTKLSVRLRFGPPVGVALSITLFEGGFQFSFVVRPFDIAILAIEIGKK